MNFFLASSATEFPERMNTLAVSQLSTLRWTMEDDVVAYSRQGFDGIGLYRPKLDDFGVDRTIELLGDAGLSVTSLSWAGGFTGSSGLGIDESIHDAITAIGEAANLRAQTLIVLAGGRNNHIRSHAKRTLCSALREIAYVAEDLDVQLSIEPIHPGCGDEWSFVNDLQSSLDIIEQVSSSHFGLTLDTYHIGMDEENLRWLADLMPYLNLLQLGDGRHCPMGEMNRCLLGEGCIPIQEIVDSIIQQGYRGPIEVELIGEDLDNVSYDFVVRHAKEFLDRLMGLVQH